MKVLWFACYVAVIVAANWAIATFGIVPVGFGLRGQTPNRTRRTCRTDV
jgi:hypothetical protein